MHPNGVPRAGERGSGLLLCVCFLGMMLSLGMNVGTVLYIAARAVLTKDQAEIELEAERVRLETARLQAQTLVEIRRIRDAGDGPK